MVGLQNFRDLGGIKTADGGVIKKGLFFRSARLDDVNDEGLEYLRSLGIKKVFDYREKNERERDAVYEIIGAERVHSNVDIRGDKLYTLSKKSTLYRAFAKISFEDVKQTYRSLPYGEGYKFMLNSLEKGEVPFLQHCSAGKDRAGFGSALLLTVLGVSYEETEKDYMLSLQVEEYITDTMLKQVPQLFKGFIARRYRPAFLVREDLLAEAFKEVKEKFGSMENYLLTQYGLTEEIIKNIRQRYVEYK